MVAEGGRRHSDPPFSVIPRIHNVHTHTHTSFSRLCVSSKRRRIKNMGGIYLIHFFDRRREKGVGEGNIKKKKKMVASRR